MATKEKVILLSIGTVASVTVALITFLTSVYFGNFVSEAAFIRKNAGQDTNIAIISTKLDNLTSGQAEIKLLLSK